MHHQHRSDNKGLSLAFWLNLLFSIIEAIGGVLTNSTAILADAFHDFMDAVAIGVAVGLEKLSGRKRSSRFSYGYKRFSLLAALGMSLFLVVGAVLMVVQAIRSFLNPEAVDSVGMLWLAVLGIVVNGFAFLRIKRGSGDSDGTPAAHNHNSRAIMLHLLEDVLGWIAVLIGAAVIYFTGWFWIDGILAIGIACFIGYNAVKNLIRTMKVLLQSVPENVEIDRLTQAILQLKCVQSMHDLHIWSLDGIYNVGSVHVVLDPTTPGVREAVYTGVLKIMEQHGVHHPTIQMETENAPCTFRQC